MIPSIAVRLVDLYWGIVKYIRPAAARTAHSPTTPLPGRRALLVHGIYDSANSMAWVKRTLENRGWHVCAISLKPSDGSISFDAMARQVQEFVAAQYGPDDKFDLVGFSMGGLVCRYYLQKLGGACRVRRFVTISTPNNGCLWAWLGRGEGVREMRPGSEMLRDLNSSAAGLAALEYTSLYTPLDLAIVPSTSSRLPVARNVIAWVPLHPLMLMMSEPLRMVAEALHGTPGTKEGPGPQAAADSEN
jgi:triacylglycerol lipase